MANKRLRISEALDLNIFYMTCYGVYPPDFCANNWKIFIYRLYSIIVMGVVFFIYSATEVINMYVVYGDMEKMVEGSFLLLTHMAQFVKIIMLLAYSERIRAILIKLDDPIFNRDKSEHNKILKLNMYRAKRDLRVFMSMVLSTMLLWAIFPIIEGNSECQLPLSTWYPFDTCPTPVFQIIYAYQLIAVGFGGLVNVSIDTLGTGIMVLTSGQLDVLNYELESLWSKSDDEKSTIERFKICVEHHQEIIRFVADQEAVFNPMYFGQFLVAMVVICITAFQLTLVPVKSIKFFSMILYMMCMLTEAYLYCYYGNEIIVKSSQLRNSAFLSGWYEESPQLCKMLIYFMQRTQRPLQVTAGKFFSLSLTTFVTILKTSYSYFALLQNIHNK